MELPCGSERQAVGTWQGRRRRGPAIGRALGGPRVWVRSALAGPASRRLGQRTPGEPQPMQRRVGEWQGGGCTPTDEGSLCARDPMKVTLLTLPSVTPRGGSRGLSPDTWKPVVHRQHNPAAAGRLASRSASLSLWRRGLTAVTWRCGLLWAPTPPRTRRWPPALSSSVPSVVQKCVDTAAGIIHPLPLTVSRLHCHPLPPSVPSWKRQSDRPKDCPVSPDLTGTCSHLPPLPLPHPHSSASSAEAPRFQEAFD